MHTDVGMPGARRAGPREAIRELSIANQTLLMRLPGCNLNPFGDPTIMAFDAQTGNGSGPGDD